MKKGISKGNSERKQSKRQATQETVNPALSTNPAPKLSPNKRKRLLVFQQTSWQDLHPLQHKAAKKQTGKTLGKLGKGMKSSTITSLMIDGCCLSFLTFKYP